MIYYFPIFYVEMERKMQIVAPLLKQGFSERSAVR